MIDRACGRKRNRTSYRLTLILATFILFAYTAGPGKADQYDTSGITVSGESSRLVVPDTLEIRCSLDVAPGTDPAPLAHAVVDVLKTDGAQDAAWTPARVAVSDTVSRPISGSIPWKPGIDVPKIVSDVISSVPAAHVQFVFFLERRDCTAIWDELRTEAIERARSRALDLATMLGVHLGEVTSTDSQQNTVACPYQADGWHVVGGSSLGEDDRIKLTRRLWVSFAIK
jgi:hypothetical protein